MPQDRRRQLRATWHWVFTALVAISVSTLTLAANPEAHPDGASTDFLNVDLDAVRPLFAEISTSAPSISDLLDRDSGVSLSPVYSGEVFTNARGGKTTKDATRYLGLLNVPLEINFEKAGLPLPGRFHVLGQTTQGQGLTRKFIGDTQVISNIDPLSNITQVSEYWYECELVEEALTMRVGKQDLNSEFLDLDMAVDFINSSFGISPTAFFPTYPSQSFAFVLLAQLSDAFELKYGAWDGFAGGGSWGFSGDGIIFHFAELDYRYALRGGRLPGSLEIGAAYIPRGKVAGAIVPEFYGYYVQLEQLVYRENATDNQGLGVFVSHFPRFLNGTFPIFGIRGDVVGGLAYTGLIPSRDDDVIGLGFAWAKLNRGGTNQETAVELFYQAQINKRMSVQPDLQYVASPSGIYRDAVAVGLRFQVEL